MSILYHGFGIIGYQYVRTTYEEGKMIFSRCKNRFRMVLDSLAPAFTLLTDPAPIRERSLALLDWCR